PVQRRERHEHRHGLDFQPRSRRAPWRTQDPDPRGCWRPPLLLESRTLGRLDKCPGLSPPAPLGTHEVDPRTTHIGIADGIDPGGTDVRAREVGPCSHVRLDIQPRSPHTVITGDARDPLARMLFLPPPVEVSTESAEGKTKQEGPSTADVRSSTHHGWPKALQTRYRMRKVRRHEHSHVLMRRTDPIREPVTRVHVCSEGLNHLQWFPPKSGAPVTIPQGRIFLIGPRHGLQGSLVTKVNVTFRSDIITMGTHLILL